MADPTPTAPVDNGRRATARPRMAALAAAVSMGLVLTACGSSDDGATVRNLNETEGGTDAAAETGSGPGSASQAASGSSSAMADGSAEPTTDTDTDTDGGYDYATDVSAHRLITADVCDIAELLDADPIDFAAVGALYRDGENSVNADGSVRTLAGFAEGSDADRFVMAAMDGTDSFDGAADSVRAQAIEKGIQNQILVAWTRDELASALTKAADANFDPEQGAIHSWDEAWAYYHGAQPGCAPYGTAESRAANFATMNADGTMAQANETILAAMNAGRDALADEDRAGAEAAVEAISGGLATTYSQAAIRYATLMAADVTNGDPEAAAEHQMEGWAFWQVIASDAATAGVDRAAIDAILDPSRLDPATVEEPGDWGAEIRAALAPFWAALGVTDDDIGTLTDG